MKNSKFCSKCETEKDKSFFHKLASSSDGLYSYCKACKKTQDRDSRLRHLDKRRLKVAEYRNKNREKIRKLNRELAKKNREQKKKYDKKRYLENKEMLIQESREYYVRNKTIINKKFKKYYQENKETIKRNARLFTVNNREKVREAKNKWCKNKLKTDPVYKLKHILRRRILFALKRSRTNKNSSTVKLIGCNFEYFKKHIESLFLPGMTWENHGFGNNKWHVGHIKPCEIFDLRDESEQKLCFNFRNVKPQWARENLSNGDILPNGELARYIPDNEKKEIRVQLYGKDIQI